VVAEVAKPGIQRAPFQVLNMILRSIAVGCGPLPEFTPAVEMGTRAALLLSHVRGALQNVRHHHGSAYQLARIKGEPLCLYLGRNYRHTYLTTVLRYSPQVWLHQISPFCFDLLDGWGNDPCVACHPPPL